MYTSTINGLTFTFKFLPQSIAEKQRNGIKGLGLHWVLTIKREGRKQDAPPWFNYWQGVGHIPHYQEGERKFGKFKAWRDYLADACETGEYLPSNRMELSGDRKQILTVQEDLMLRSRAYRKAVPVPTVGCVLSCLVLDSYVLGMGFEEWAEEYGYDPESRKAEATFNECLEQTNRLIKAVGLDGLRKMQELDPDKWDDGSWLDAAQKGQLWAGV